MANRASKLGKIYIIVIFLLMYIPIFFISSFTPLVMAPRWPTLMGLHYAIMANYSPINEC